MILSTHIGVFRQHLHCDLIHIIQWYNMQKLWFRSSSTISGCATLSNEGNIFNARASISTSEASCHG